MKTAGISPEFDGSTWKSVLDYFHVLLTLQFVDDLVKSTNEYSKTWREANPGKHWLIWTPVDVPAMRIFLALTMLIHILKKARIQDYWWQLSKLSTSFFSLAMKRD